MDGESSLRDLRKLKNYSSISQRSPFLTLQALPCGSSMAKRKNHSQVLKYTALCLNHSPTCHGLGLTPQSSSWEDTTHSLLSQTGNKQKIYLSTLAWQATIYELWWERNNRLHRRIYHSQDRIIKRIAIIIRNRISSLRPHRSALASDLSQLWFTLFPS
ncbi:Uncharacterized protein Rs2_49836 [Raphanus sativus]|nr:Uncharacterized protein Rs2_49836 [Raphanus sativus]